MKKKTLPRKELEKTPTPKELAVFFEKVSGKVLEDTRAVLKNDENYITTCERELALKRASREKNQKKLEKLEADGDKRKEEAKADSEKLFNIFNKDINFDEFKVDEYFKIRTNLIFADIRRSAGIRTHKRACLGAFTIYLPTPITRATMDDVYVENLTFDYPRENWAVNGGRVCWGEWKTDIRDAMSRWDYYQMFQVILTLLKSADEDGAAYMRSHDWRDKRRLREVIHTEPIKAGDYVIFTAEFQDDLRILGHVAQCSAASGNVGMFVIKNINGKGAFSWNVLLNSCTKIPKEMYDQQDVYKIKAVEINPVAKILKGIDEMPEGATKEDADAYIKDMVSKKQIQLDISKLMKS